MDWKAIQIVLGDGAIFVLNGFLATAYWLYGQAPLLATLPAVLWALHFDRSTWRQAGFRSRRYDRGTVIRAGHSATLWTLAAAGIWLAAALLSASPVPAIGAAMWWGMALGARLMPREREALLFRHKGLIAGYGLLALGLWALLTTSPSLGRLSELVGSWREAAELVGSVQGSLVPYVALVVWVLYPAGYFVLLAQRYLVHRGPQVGPGATAEQVIQELRQRERAR